MYKIDPNVNTPIDKNLCIWRFIDLTKLLSLLETESLYFCRSDKFNDPFEGSITKPALEAMKKEVPLPAQKVFHHFKEKAFLNCWHLSDYESEAMWKLYSKSNLGIAIKSNVGRLINSFSVEDVYDVFVGRINYLDYEKEYFNYGNIFCYFFNKRKSFECEKELRAMVSLAIENPKRKANESYDQFGINIKINLNELIENIFIAPFSPFWYRELIKSVLKRYNTGFNVLPSSLDNEPLFW
jgi:hypothetical protein